MEHHPVIESVIRIVKFSLSLAEAVWFYVRNLTRKILGEDVLLLASGLAFNGILSMIPLMLLTASAVGSFLNSSELGVRQLHEVLDAIFPAQPFATSIKQSILTVVSDIITYRTSLGVFGAAILIWTASSLFDALRSVLHKVYGIKRTRSLIVGFLHDIGFVIVVFVLFVASNLAIWVFSLVEQISELVPALGHFDFSGLNQVVPTLVVFGLTATMFYIVYRYIPDSKPPRTTAVISTVTTTVLWVLSGKLFALYLSDFSAIGTLYGPYAFILVLLIWIYYSSIIFVLGGMVGQVHWERAKLREAGLLERWS